VEGNNLIIRPLNRIHLLPKPEMKYHLRIVQQDLRLHWLSVDPVSDGVARPVQVAPPLAAALDESRRT
jgi:hypothetical protein